GRFKQAPGAAPCLRDTSVRGLCTGGGNILLVAAEKGEEKGRTRGFRPAITRQVAILDVYS
ncbi:MAG: hypothetical protein K5651_02975, partial [Bacteroidales bacterium]|nr:hypothetical protein [Bacteroidales bacterium]